MSAQRRQPTPSSTGSAAQGQARTYCYRRINALHVALFHQDFQRLFAKRLHISLRKWLTALQLLNPAVQVGGHLGRHWRRVAAQPGAYYQAITSLFNHLLRRPALAK